MDSTPPQPATTAREPIRVFDQAIKGKTLQEYLEATKESTGKQFGFPGDVGNVTYYSPQQIGWMAQGATKIYRDAGLPCEPQVIGLRARSSIEWVVSFLALIRGGHTVLVLSPVMPLEKIAILMQKAAVDIVIDGTKDWHSLGERLEKNFIAIAPADKLTGKLEYDNDSYRQSWTHIRATDPAIIMPSSGSTGLPKLIPKTHIEVLTKLAAIPTRVLEWRYFVGSWMHYIGGIYCLLYTFAKDSPSVWPSESTSFDPKDYQKILSHSAPDIAWFNPVVLKLASSTEEGLEVLRRCKLVVTAGQVCPKQLGDNLVAAGVRLRNEYGMTELAVGLGSVPGDTDWEYLQPDPFSAPHVEFRPLLRTEGSTQELYEFVVLPTHPTQNKALANDEDGAFHTGDVFIKHPNKPLFKCLGRASDDFKILHRGQLVWVNVVAYENCIMAENDDILQEAVVFGNNRPYPGVLLFTKPDCRLAVGSVVERIWATIQRDINGKLPVDIRKSMILVVPDFIMPRTGKGNFIRPEVYLRNESIIQTAYDTDT
ncbi:acetyl-CoA synthetase-like protein [Hyaloscypha variabilis]